MAEATSEATKATNGQVGQPGLGTARIRHIGITTTDPGATADFFIKGFGFVEVLRRPDNEAAIVSDGYINVTLLKFKVDRYGGGRPGLHHFGIKVEDLAQAEGQIAPLGAVELAEWNRTYGNQEGTPEHWVGERKWMTPEGISIDVNPSGWVTRPGGARGE
jgi:catechol 2,3-dioxygenase-like lactoylglutathione lyase family enzyme